MCAILQLVSHVGHANCLVKQICNFADSKQHMRSGDMLSHLAGAQQPVMVDGL